MCCCRYREVLGPIINFVCKRLPLSRETTADDLSYEDLGRLVPEDVACICEWLTAKVDSLSAKIELGGSKMEEEVSLSCFSYLWEPICINLTLSLACLKSHMVAELGASFINFKIECVLQMQMSARSKVGLLSWGSPQFCNKHGSLRAPANQMSAKLACYRRRLFRPYICLRAYFRGPLAESHLSASLSNSANATWWPSLSLRLE